jgi:hypothetical protein
MSQEQTIEVRLALLESGQIQAINNHKEVMAELKTVSKKLDERQCTLHSARMLQLDQDMARIKDVDVPKLWEKHDAICLKIEDVQIKLAFWAGAVGVVSFLATRVFK